MTTFVLVHGAFRGGWAWRFVREGLTARGHDVWTPSLTGMGDRVHVRPTDSAVIHLDDWVEDIAALVRTNDLRDVVLVGHSLGGFVTVAATTAIADRVARVDLLDAPVPQDGQRAVDLNPEGIPIPRAEDLDLSASLPARPVTVEEGFTPELAAWVNERLAGTPFGPSFYPAVVSAEAEQVPRRHIFFSETPRSFPCWTSRARLDAAGAPYVELAGGHDAPLTDPAGVIELLLATDDEFAGRASVQ